MVASKPTKKLSLGPKQHNANRSRGFYRRLRKNLRDTKAKLGTRFQDGGAPSLSPADREVLRNAWWIDPRGNNPRVEDWE